MMLSDKAKNYLLGLAAVLVLLAILGALFYPYPSKAEGTTANVSWILPACYNDGTPAVPPATGCGTQSPLPPADILSVTVKWSGTITGQVTLTGAPTATQVNIPCASTAFTVLVTTKPTAKYSASSPESNPVTYATGVQCRPNPPTAVTAN